MTGSIYNKFRRITSNKLYFPEIDGIRFLAILLVFLFHVHGYFKEKSIVPFVDDKNSYKALNDFFENGDRGVSLFFVLSGFILCMPFAHHYINKGKKVNLKKYYLRRVTRLEPPYILAMTGLLVLHMVMKTFPVSELVPHWLASLGYLHNIIYHRVPLLTVVAWSLEVEIQFYIIAPILFRVLALPKLLRRTLVILAIGGIVFAQQHHLREYTISTLFGQAQFFLMGILLADVYVSDTAASLFKKAWVIPASALLLYLICMFPVRYILQNRIAYPFFIGLFYYMIMKNETIKKIFSWKFIPIVGGMCYSIYLLHYTIVSFAGKFTMKLRITDCYIPNLFLQFVLLGSIVLVISSVFYLYVERPFMDNKWTKMFFKKDKDAESETNA